MAFPSAVAGSYVGTGSTISISEVGFQPSFIRIWNDTDNDVAFEFFSGQSSGLAVSVGNSSFSGAAPYASQTLTIEDQDSPEGTPIYVKFMQDGSPYLACDMANDEEDKLVDFSGSARLLIKHDENAAVGGLQLYFNPDGTSVNERLLVDNSIYNGDVFIRLQDGSLLRLKHDADAATNGDAINYDDDSDQRIEGELTGDLSADCSTEAQGWKTVTPSGSLGTVISEISSGGVTINDRGFQVGTNSSINESGKTYRYVAFR